MNWTINHWQEIAGIITGAVTIFSIIAKITKTETDDKILGIVLKIVDILAINNKPTEIKPKAQKPSKEIIV